MRAVSRIEALVREIVRKRAAHAPDLLTPDTTLGSGGIGLDSISLAEVLLDCQQKFNVSVTSLLEGEPLTLRRLVAHLEEESAA